MPDGVCLYDFEEFVEVDGATLVDIDGVKALLEALVVPGCTRVCPLHQHLAEIAALFDIEVPVSVLVSLAKYGVNDRSELLNGHFRLGSDLGPLLFLLLGLESAEGQILSLVRGLLSFFTAVRLVDCLARRYVRKGES